MKLKRHMKISGLLSGLIFFLATSALCAPKAPLSVAFNFDFASGNYGTTQTVDSYSTTLIIGYNHRDVFDFSLEIPYLYQNGGSTVSLGGNRFPMQTSDSSIGGTSGGGMGGMSGVGTATSRTDSQTGLGDISLTAGYKLHPESATAPMLRPIIYIKAPTADKDKGLGTGAFDFGGGLSTFKIFGDWSVYAETLYIVPGSTASYRPDNYWTYQGSVSYLLTRKLNTGLAISGATAAFAGNSSALEVQLNSGYRLSERGSVGAYLGFGLTDSSPDYTAGFYGAIRF
jgi:hypothetical protein